VSKREGFPDCGFKYNISLRSFPEETESLPPIKDFIEFFLDFTQYENN